MKSEKVQGKIESKSIFAILTLQTRKIWGRSFRKQNVRVLMIKGSSQEKLYQELNLGHLYQRRWMRRLYLFYKVFHSKVPKALFHP